MQVVWALHSKRTPSLQDLAIKKVLELELPLGELPLDVLDKIQEGPGELTLSDRGSDLMKMLMEKDKKDQAPKLKEEEDELAFILAEEEEDDDSYSEESDEVSEVYNVNKSGDEDQTFASDCNSNKPF